MPPLTRLAVIPFLITTAHARNETVIHGWVHEPNGRGTWTILWSCLATIFLCTWSALHLNVPKRHSPWYLFFRRLGWMFTAAAAPEMLLHNSAENFFQARALSKHLIDYGKNDWKLTQTQFACASGFYTRTPGGEESRCNSKQLVELVKNGIIDGPPISEDELKSRGQSDWIIKFIAVLQIAWFGIQTVFRAIQHFQTTSLEIMTVAFVFCSVFIYGFSFKQPQNVAYAVLLETRITPPVADRTTLQRDSEKSDNKGETSKTVSARSGLENRDFVPGWAAANIPDTLFILFASGFRAIHCLAWNSPFPTPKERLAWRICSTMTTALPAITLMLIGYIKDAKGGLGVQFLWLISSLLALFYFVGRITIIVLAFMTLRALPADAFQTVNWNNYLPHFVV